MKLHYHLVKSVVETLGLIFNENKYADKAIEAALRGHKKWGSRDRRFFAEATYDIVRWWRLLLAVTDQEDRESIDYWPVMGAWLLTIKDQDLPDYEELKNLNPQNWVQRLEVLQKQVSYRESIPDWIDQLGASQLKESWPKALRELNQPAPVFLRTNRIKTDPETLQARLKEEGIETHTLDFLPDGLCLEVRKNVFKTQAFKEGLFEVQDGSSQQVAPFLQVEPGQRVIDACAGAGGKSLHLAALMKNKGRIIALDVYQSKLNELKKRSRRNGVDIIETREITSTKVTKRLAQQADRLLLDVPCTGLGVLRRNPDTKWKLTPERLEELIKIQRDILSRYSKMVKPGGKMVYATCSLLPKENREQVDWFLSEHSQWVLEEDRSILPGENNSDGFYMARLRFN